MMCLPIRTSSGLSQATKGVTLIAGNLKVHASKLTKRVTIPHNEPDLTYLPCFLPLKITVLKTVPFTSRPYHTVFLSAHLLRLYQCLDRLIQGEEVAAHPKGVVVEEEDRPLEGEGELVHLLEEEELAHSLEEVVQVLP